MIKINQIIDYQSKNINLVQHRTLFQTILKLPNYLKLPTNKLNIVP